MDHMKPFASAFFALTLALAAPFSAFAATSVTIENTNYSAAANGTGSGGGTWNWDGQNAMALNNFVSDNGISYVGSLTIELSGTNEVASLVGVRDDAAINIEGDVLAMEQQNLGAAETIITGDGTLETERIKVDGPVTIKDTSVEVNYESDATADDIPSAVLAGDLTVQNSNLTVNAKQGDSAPVDDGLTGIDAGSVTIKDSDVTVSAEAKEGTYVEGISALGTTSINWGVPHNNGTIAIEHSNVDIKLSKNGIAAQAWGQWTYDGGNISDGTITISNSKIVSPNMYVTDIKDYYGQNMQAITPVEGEVNGSLFASSGIAEATNLFSEGVKIEKDVQLPQSAPASQVQPVPAPQASSVWTAQASPTKTIAAAPTTTETPKTADTQNLILWAFVALFSGLLACIAYGRLRTLKVPQGKHASK